MDITNFYGLIYFIIWLPLMSKFYEKQYVFLVFSVSIVNVQTEHHSQVKRVWRKTDLILFLMNNFLSFFHILASLWKFEKFEKGTKIQFPTIKLLHNYNFHSIRFHYSLPSSIWMLYSAVPIHSGVVLEEQDLKVRL